MKKREYIFLPPEEAHLLFEVIQKIRRKNNDLLSEEDILILDWYICLIERSSKIMLSADYKELLKLYKDNISDSSSLDQDRP